MTLTTRRHGLDPEIAELLDKAYSHAKTLLVAHDDPALSVHLMTGAEPTVAAWFDQAQRQAQAGDYAACRQSLLGWCRAIQAQIRTAENVQKGGDSHGV